MISANRCISPSLRSSYVARNGGSGNVHGFMKTQGAVGSSKNSIESSWLIAKGGTGSTLNVQWGTYLATKGFTVGSLKERMKAFFLTGTQS